jgi:hypothetical protein
MKKITLILTVLIAITIKANAQISNSGFETWVDYVDTGDCNTPHFVYQTPDMWKGSLGIDCHLYLYSIQKNNESYPAGTGQFSMQIQSDTADGVRGMAAVATNSQSPMAPAFSITGHPTSLTGYYKFLPLNGDTMNIVIVLFQSGVMVAGGTLKETTTVSNWTSFNIPISSYTTADSALIFLASYNLTAGTIPHGNSTLYIDNLNFDNLITSVTEQNSGNTTFNLFPNPATDIVTLNINENSYAEVTLNIYNAIGLLVKTRMFNKNQNQLNTSDLSNGIYMIEIKSQGLIENKKLIIQR